MPLKQQILEDMASHGEPWSNALRLMAHPGPTEAYWNDCADQMRLLGALANSDRGPEVIEIFGEIIPQVKTALMAQIAIAPPAEVDRNDANYWHHEMAALDRVDGNIRMASVMTSVDAALETARATPGQSMQVDLQDWRVEGGQIPEEGEPAIAPPAVLHIQASPVCLNITAGDGRSVSIELEGGNLRVLAYNAMKDEPFLVKIPTNDVITAEDQDYRAGALLTAEGPSV